MTLDLFSGFDPENLTFSMKLDFMFLMWLMVVFVPIAIMLNHKLSMNPCRTIFSMIMALVYDLVSRSQLKALGGSVPFFVALFTFILTVNLLGLSPYTFSLTSHMSFNFSMAFPLWLSIILMSFTYSLPLSLSHLTPSGAPMYLAPFLVLIETVSILVRSVTLAVRLSANITTGHILMSMLSVLILSMSSYKFFMMMILGTGYFLFEMAIMLVQAYIFTLLPTLYADEHAK